MTLCTSNGTHPGHADEVERLREEFRLFAPAFGAVLHCHDHGWVSDETLADWQAQSAAFFRRGMALGCWEDVCADPEVGRNWCYARWPRWENRCPVHR